MKVLLIGGPLDGTFYKLDTIKDEILVADPHMSYYINRSDEPKLWNEPIKTYLYRHISINFLTPSSLITYIFVKTP